MTGDLELVLRAQTVNKHMIHIEMMSLTVGDSIDQFVAGVLVSFCEVLILFFDCI